MHWEIYSILYGIFKAQSFMRFEVAAYNRSLKKEIKKRYFIKAAEFNKILIARSKSK